MMNGHAASPRTLQSCARATAAKMFSFRRVAPADVTSQALDPVDAKTRAEAQAIVDDVRAGGTARLREIAEKFGDIKPGEPLVLHRAELEAAFRSLPEVRPGGVARARKARRKRARARARVRLSQK